MFDFGAGKMLLQIEYFFPGFKLRWKVAAIFHHLIQPHSTMSATIGKPNFSIAPSVPETVLIGRLK